MCGIVGIWDQSNRNDQERLSHEVLTAVKMLHHRGPDDNGVWTNGHGLGFGHTRLSILDLSSHGHQPMISADGRFVLVYNGEVYNFAEIRETLSSLGYSFNGSGDTEVILASFQEWGDAAVHRFIGMFAIAIYDGKKNDLHLIRDRAGVKPLVYYHKDDLFMFASELKAFHQHPDFEK